MAKELERGDIFYFYRPKVDAEKPSDVQRFYIVLANASLFRLLIVGAQKLPQSDSGSGPASRRWALVRAVSGGSGEIETILKGGEYETKTRGRRHLPPAAPLGEGRYAIVNYDRTTQLAYRLKRSKSGKLSETFGLDREASFIIAVKNPGIRIKGFPEDKPGYPDALENLFKGRRWIHVANPGLLNYPDAQIALIAGFDDDAAEALGVDLDEKIGDVRSEIDLDLPEEGLLESRFPDLFEFAKRHHGKIETEFGAGGLVGGVKAARSSASASAVARLLTGIEFPADKEEVLDTARANSQRLETPEAALDRLKRLPERSFGTAAELQQALSGATAEDIHTCEICGRRFEDASTYQRHLETSHPEQAVSAADIEAALHGVSFPKDAGELAAYAEESEAGDPVIEAIRGLPDRRYRDAAEVAMSFQERITGERRKAKQAPSEKALRSTSAAALAKALSGIDLPARPSGLYKQARKNDAAASLLELVEKMPDRDYRNLAEVERGFSEAKSRQSRN